MDTKQCPYCSGEILTTAKKCKHCGEWLNESTVAQNEMMECPFCLEEIEAGLKICPVCQESFSNSTKSLKLKSEAVNKKPVMAILVGGIIAFILVVTGLIWVGIKNTMNDEHVDSSEVNFKTIISESTQKTYPTTNTFNSPTVKQYGENIRKSSLSYYKSNQDRQQSARSIAHNYLQILQLNPSNFTVENTPELFTPYSYEPFIRPWLTIEDDLTLVIYNFNKYWSQINPLISWDWSPEHLTSYFNYNDCGPEYPVDFYDSSLSLEENFQILTSRLTNLLDFIVLASVHTDIPSFKELAYLRTYFLCEYPHREGGYFKSTSPFDLNFEVYQKPFE